MVTHLSWDKKCRLDERNVIRHFLYTATLLRSEGLKIPESIAQDFGFTVVREKQVLSNLRNCFFSTEVEIKDKLGWGIIESLLLRWMTEGAGTFPSYAILLAHVKSTAEIFRFFYKKAILAALYGRSDEGG